MYNIKMFKNIAGFDWHIGNFEKCQKHGLSIDDIDFIFRNNPKIATDTKHSQYEERYIELELMKMENMLSLLLRCEKLTMKNIYAQ